MKMHRAQQRRYYIFTDIWKNPISYLLALPAIVYTFIFGYATLPYLLMAFQKFSYNTSYFWNNEIIGFKNFEFFFRSDNFITVTWNTLRLNFLFIVFTSIIAILLAIILNEIKTRWFMRISQSLFLFPHFLSWVIVSYVVYNVF